MMPTLVWNGTTFEAHDDSIGLLNTLGVIAKQEDGDYRLATADEIVGNPNSIVKEGITPFDRASLVQALMQCFLSLPDE